MRDSRSVSLEQRLHHQGGIDGTAARLDDDADVLRRLVADVGNERQPLRLHQLGDLLDQPRLLDLVGNLGDDDDVGAASLLLDFPARPHAEAAAAGLVSLDHRRAFLDDNPAGREIRPRHHSRRACRPRHLRVLDEVKRRVAELGGIVRRNVGRHADGDAGRAIGEEVGERAGENDGLLVLTVIGRAEVDGVLVDAVEEETGDLGQPRFGVAHGRGVIAVDIAEIALALRSADSGRRNPGRGERARRRSPGRHGDGNCP